MIITRSLNKRKGVLIETVHAVKRCVRVEFTKVIIEKWIIRDPTVQGDWRTYQLAWYLVTRIVHDNPNVSNFISKLY